MTAPANPLRSGKGHDAAISQQQDDDLQRWAIARSVLRSIESAPDSWSTRIGLYGKWGSGKTSVLNFIEEQARMRNESKPDGITWVVVRFSAWDAEGRDGVIQRFYQALLEQLEKGAWSGKSFKDLGRGIARLLGNVAEIGKSVVQVMDPVSGMMVSKGTQIAEQTGQLLSSKLAFNRKELEALCAELERTRIVVFIDDLDRADPTAIPKAMLALRELLDWPSFAFVLAFDLDVVSKALSLYSAAYGENGQRFLEKIIDISITLPEPTPEQARRLAWRAFRECCPFIPEAAFTRIAQWFPGNPRLVKAISRDLGQLKTVAVRHGEGELAWDAIILQTIIKHEAPKTLERLEPSLLGLGGRSLRGETEEEREAFEREAIQLSLGSTVPDLAPAFRRLKNQLSALHDLRKFTDPARVRYEMGLLAQEPSITLQEHRRFLNEWAADFDDRRIDLIIEEGADAAQFEVREAASNLVWLTIESYCQGMRDLASQVDQRVYDQQLQSLGVQLKLLEKVWGDTPHAALRDVADHYGLCCSLIDGLLSLRERDEGQPGQAQYQREIALVTAAATTCSERVRLYDWAMEKLLSGGIASVLNMHKKPRLNDIASLLKEDAVADLLTVFEAANGVERLFKDSSPAAIQRQWRLLAAKSPFYQEAAQASLVARLESIADDGLIEGIVASNMLDYLVALALHNHNSAEGERHDVQRLQALIPFAWAAAMKGSEYHRSPQQLLGKWDTLVNAGIDKSWIELPANLAELDRQRRR
ncbi:KAP family NTPase [Pseudomonas sp. B21-035]|uniref:KAP family P-loop NTPase fold protein n=1 Tax=Pseudomonas sp. B21-035 TaxID=2895484 RepID=UPI002160CA0E|nr:KAP family NTPase [Pseudomonas sp. B21-035]UVL54372.1 KAP family NTPase [Pseudomonas sp. B21-035]